VIITPSAAKIPQDDVDGALGRHARGDWGQSDLEGRAENEAALKKGSPIASIFTSKNGIKFYMITEGDRSATTILLPEEY
jgi:hypothetical protein